MRKTITAALAIGVLSGCASTPMRADYGATIANQAGENRDPKATSPQTIAVNLLPLLTINIPTPQSGSATNMSGGYTRIFASGPVGGTVDPRTGQPVGFSDRIYENRGWLRRWAVGRSLSRVLTLKVTLVQPNVSTTTTLASSSHLSNRAQGEVWSTDLNGRLLLTPYFRVDPASRVGIETAINASSLISADVTGSIVNLLGQAVELVAPGTRLLTALNSERVGAASRFVDQAVSTLFSETLSERSTNQFGLQDWSNTGFVTIGAKFPMGTRVSDGHRTIGTWTVHAERPIVSIFSDVPLCADILSTPAICARADRDSQAKIAFAGLSPYIVLDLPVAENLRLGQALRADAGVSAALATQNSADADGRARRARALCAAIADRAAAIGLNDYDIAATVWAVSRTDMVPGEIARLLTSPETCEAATLFRSLQAA